MKVTRASIATFTVCRSLNVGKCYAYTLQKIKHQLIKKKLPKKSVKEMESEVYLNFFEKLSPRINLANENRLNSLFKMLSQLFTTIL